MWRCEYYATLTLWRISCECKTFIFAAYSPEMIRLPRRITEKVRPFKWLRMLPNVLQIPANFLRSLRSVCRISCESFANVKTTYECLTITTNALSSIRIYCDAYENNNNNNIIIIIIYFRREGTTYILSIVSIYGEWVVNVLLK